MEAETLVRGEMQTEEMFEGGIGPFTPGVRFRLGRLFPV